MKPLIIVTAFLFVGFTSFTYIVHRQQGETTTAFVNRLVPDSTQMVDSIIETKTWTTQPAIIAFHSVDDTADPNEGFNRKYGHLYLPVGNNNYRDIGFGPIMENGGYPEIISVFFANADKDAAKELVVLCKLEQQHYDYGGNFYETYIFDNPGATDELTYFYELSNKFFGCNCWYREEDRPEETAKYKTASDIKEGLKQMGF